MATPLEGDVESLNGLELTSPQFEDGEQLPDSTGYVNENANPELEVSGVPDDAESLVLVMDDPDAAAVVGHTFNHLLVWDIDPDIGTIPEGWDGEADGAVEGFNDFVEKGYSGPSPPEGSHSYRFKLLALDSKLEMPPETRKARLGSAIVMQAEILASTQLVGTYDASQGTAY